MLILEACDEDIHILDAPQKEMKINNIKPVHRGDPRAYGYFGRMKPRGSQMLFLEIVLEIWIIIQIEAF